MSRVEVDRDRCVGSGTCEALAPDVFEVGDDGVLAVLRPEPARGRAARRPGRRHGVPDPGAARSPTDRGTAAEPRGGCRRAWRPPSGTTRRRAATRSGTATASSGSPPTSGAATPTVFTHTEVDPDAGQDGLGSTLVRAALDDVRRTAARVVAAVLVRARLDRAAPGVRRPRGPPPRPVTGPDVADHVLGDPDAPVTAARVRRLRVPVLRGRGAGAARRWSTESGGRVRLVFRNFPLADVHPFALTAALAAEAAGAQGAFWPMHDLLFARQDRLDDAALRAYAERARPRRRAGWSGTPAQVFGDKVRGRLRRRARGRGGGHARPCSSTARLYAGAGRGGRCAARPAMAGRTAQARTDGATQGRGGSDGGPSVSGEHSENRSPRTRSRTTPAIAAIS